MSQIVYLISALIGVAAAFVLKDQGYSPLWGLGWAGLMVILLVGKIIAVKRQEKRESISITQ